MASVTYDHVWKKFGDFTALNDLNIGVEDKEFLVLVGPSGCGKTTALRCLAGLEEVTQGRVLISDQTVNDVAPKDRDIAMVFQSYALYPHMTVFDNMAFGLKLGKLPRTKSSVGSKKRLKFLGSSSFSSGDLVSFPAVSGNALQWDALLSANPRSSCLMNHFLTWMQN